jgi:hypothetical protein
MDLPKKFISLDKHHSFTIGIVENTAYFQIENINPEYYKTFLLLLKQGFNYMAENNVLYVKQHINSEDAELFKKSTFIKENTTLIAKTNIEDFLFELTDCLGIKRL